jgi:hypothetical protein
MRLLPEVEGSQTSLGAKSYASQSGKEKKEFTEKAADYG